LLQKAKQITLASAFTVNSLSLHTLSHKINTLTPKHKIWSEYLAPIKLTDKKRKRAKK
jgi:hypothetical protein